MVTAYLVACLALLISGASASASIGRVVAIGDSMASGMGLGTALPMINPACGRTSGSYPSLTAAKLSPTTFVDVTCNGGHSGVYEFDWEGLPQAPNNNGATIPPQYDALNAATEAVILGTGGNEAYFGEVAKACTGADHNVNVFYHGGTYTNSCAAYDYSNPGHNLIATRINNSKTEVADVLSDIHQISPNAKIFLVGIPRVARPNGVGCMFSGMFMTAADGPVYATWEDGLRSAMISDVNAFNSSVPGNYVRFVDAQTISGTTHTMCETNWSDRWMNNWVAPTGVPNWGLELHNTPTGAEMMSRAIVDSVHAAGLDTGSQATNPTNPVVTITAPTNGLVTKNASAALAFTASDNVAIASCSRASGSSVALAPGPNTITVSCQDHAGNTGQASVTVTRDNTPPSIAIDSPQDGENTTASSIALTYSASDNLGSPSCTPASGSSRPLITGSNTLTVSCSDSAGNSASASVVVNRGSVPLVAISSPANGASTTTETINVAYTVNGVAAIPGGTSCTVAGDASTSASSNAVTLLPGSNQITVSCANQFGGSTPVSVNVIGSPPTGVQITAPSADAITSATSINVAYKIDGSMTIPAGTTCTVAGLASSNTASNSVSLVLGINTITVTCTGAFGSDSNSVNVTRGNPPTVAITAPNDGASTAAASINVAYTVDGGASVPGGTTCTVGASPSGNANTNSHALAVGINEISVVCTNQFGQSAPASVSVTRGAPPVVAITDPSDNTNTTASSINVAYTVGGAGSIPGGTTCQVEGVASSSAASNPVALSLGSNSITVACTNSFGTGTSPAINVNRGSLPSVAITAPTNATNTTDDSINVAYTVDGGAAIPGGTTCQVEGAASSSAASNPVALSIGSNSITVSCSNAFGTSTVANVTVNRGVVPSVVITAPANNTNTTASSINLSYTVDGSGSIPGGTTCTVNGSGSTTPSTNPRALVLGANVLTVECQNAFGASTPRSITINRGVPPVVAIITPTDGTETTANSVNVSYSVDGGSTIAPGTNCSVGGAASTSTSVNAFNSSGLGTHTIAVSCTNAFGSHTQYVTITRGNGPTVAITAPSSGATTNGITNVSFTVNGGSSIPAGVNCAVDGQQTTNTTTNSVPLVLDQVNVIDVSCSNNLGTDTKSVALKRGTSPTVTISSPANGQSTAAETVDVSFAASGSGPLTCTVTVNGVPAPSATAVPLVIGANTIAVTCASVDFGADTDTTTIHRGPLPVLYVNHPLHSEIHEAQANANYSIDGNFNSVPTGTTCTVNGSPSTDPSTNPMHFAPGENAVTVTCTNAFGSSSKTVHVTYTPPPGPPVAPGEPATPAPIPAGPSKLAVKLVGPRAFKPARRGGIVMKRGSRGGLKLQVKLDVAAIVELQIERLRGGRPKKSKLVAQTTLVLPAGSSTSRLAGRSETRALAAGSYRVWISVPGTDLRVASKTFRVKR